MKIPFHPFCSPHLPHHFLRIPPQTIFQILRRAHFFNPRPHPVFIKYIYHHLHRKRLPQLRQKHPVPVCPVMLKILMLFQPPCHLPLQCLRKQVNHPLLFPLARHSKDCRPGIIIGYLQAQQFTNFDPVVKKQFHHHLIPQTNTLAEIAVQFLILLLDCLKKQVNLLFR